MSNTKTKTETSLSDKPIIIQNSTINKHSSAMRRHDVDGNFARLFNNVGKFFMLKINLSYFHSRARLNFQWIFKELDLKSNMKGFFENFLALIGKETEESVDDLLSNPVIICAV